MKAISNLISKIFQTKKTFYHSISFDCLSFLSCNNIFSIHQSKQRLKCFTVFTYSSTFLHSTYISWLQIGLLSAAKSRANLLPTYRSCSFNLFITINLKNAPKYFLCKNKLCLSHSLDSQLLHIIVAIASTFYLYL